LPLRYFRTFQRAENSIFIRDLLQQIEVTLEKLLER